MNQHARIRVVLDVNAKYNTFTPRLLLFASLQSFIEDMYETDRLILRALKSSDIDDLLSVDTEEIRRLTSPGYNIPRTPQQTLEDFESYAKPPNLFCIITHKGSKSSSTWSSSNDERGAFMGFVMLRMANQKNKEGEVGIVIGDKWQGKGYGTEVLRWLISFGFKQLGLHRIALDASAINEGAIALYRRL